jgi:hypothetical protein
MTTEERIALMESVADRVDGLVDRAVARAKAALADYEDVPAEDLRAGIMTDLSRAIGALLEERPLTDDDRAGMGQIGDLRARQGIPLEGMLQVYRFTIDEIFNELWSAAEDGVVPHEQAVALTRDLWQYADPIMDVAVQSYRKTELEQAIADTQGRTALVHGLLLGTGGKSTASSVLGAHLDPNASYVAIRARCASGDVRQLLLDLQTPGVLEGATVAPHEGDVIGFAVKRPAYRPGPGVIIGVGPPVSLGALPQSLAIATRVVETANAYGVDGLRSLDQLALEAIARSEDVIGDHLVARYVDRCEPQTATGAEMLDTVRALLTHDLGIDQTASAMTVHPNTVRNRLRRYEQLTGSSLRSVDDLISIRLALLRADLGERDARAEMTAT